LGARAINFANRDECRWPCPRVTALHHEREVESLGFSAVLLSFPVALTVRDPDGILVELIDVGRGSG